MRITRTNKMNASKSKGKDIAYMIFFIELRQFFLSRKYFQPTRKRAPCLGVIYFSYFLRDLLFFFEYQKQDN